MAPLLLFLFWLQFSDAARLPDTHDNARRHKFKSKFNWLMERSTGALNCVPRVGVLGGYKVCYDPSGTRTWDKTHGTGRKFSTTVTINSTHLGQGSDVNTEANRLTKERTKPCSCDNAGHVIAKRLGGRGEPYNIIPQNGQLNRNLWYKQETLVYNFLAHTKAEEWKRSVTMKFAFVYGDIAYPDRPSEFHYIFEFYEDREPQSIVMGYFVNENQEENGELEEYEGFYQRLGYILYLPPENAQYPHANCVDAGPPPAAQGHFSQFVGNSTKKIATAAKKNTMKDFFAQKVTCKMESGRCVKKY